MKIGIIKNSGEPLMVAVYGKDGVSIPEALEMLGERRVNELSEFITCWQADIVSLNEKIRGLYQSGKAKDFIFPLQNAEFLPPFPKNPKILTGRGNSTLFTQAVEVPLCRQPIIEQRYNFNYAGHNSTLTFGPDTLKGGWNYEIAAVMGKTAKDVKKENAYEYIFGYTSMIDMSVGHTDYPFNEGNKWEFPENEKVFLDYAFQGCFNSNISGPIPLGPVIVTKDEAGDPHAQVLTERESGRLISRGLTDGVIFTFPEEVEYLTSFMTLDPGDMINSASISYDGYPFGKKYKEGSYIQGETTNIDAVRIYINDEREEKA